MGLGAEGSGPITLYHTRKYHTGTMCLGVANRSIRTKLSAWSRVSVCTLYANQGPREPAFRDPEMPLAVLPYPALDPRTLWASPGPLTPWVSLDIPRFALWVTLDIPRFDLTSAPNTGLRGERSEGAGPPHVFY